jgi:hypothetical protein
MATYTVTGSSGGHQLVSATWTITTSAAFTGTFAATPSGGVSQCGLYSPFTVTFSGGTSNTFSFTPQIADTVTFTFTNTGGLTPTGGLTGSGTTANYTATGEYLLDTFSGSGTIQGHTSNTLPSGLAGSSWSAPATGAITLDGSGEIYLSTATTPASPLTTSNSAQSTNSPTLPVAGSNFEVIFEFSNTSSSGMGSNWAGVTIMSGGGNTLGFGLNGNGYLSFLYNGAYTGGVVNFGQGTPPGNGVSWLIKIDVTAVSNQWSLTASYSTNLSTPTWTNLTLGAAYPWYEPMSALTGAAPSATVFLAGTAGQSVVKLGNLIVQDQTPPSPNCQVPATITTPANTTMPGAYVCLSGKTIAVFFETISGLSAVVPTAYNYAAGVYQNGTLIGAASPGFITGNHLCAMLQVPNNVTIAPTDTVTLSAPASWMTCGSGNAASAMTHMAVANYVGKSQANINSISHTLRPGFNIANLGPYYANFYGLLKNWRYKLTPNVFATNTVDGYPQSAPFTAIQMEFYDQSGYNNEIDSTTCPGAIGLWAIGYDDLNYATAPTTVTIVTTGSGSDAVVTQIASNNNPGSSGMGQYYLFNVTSSGSSTSATPLEIQFSNSTKSFVTSGNAPSISNLVIYGPATNRMLAGTASVNNGSTSLTTSVSQVGLVGTYVVLGTDTSHGFYQVSSGSGTSWTLATAFGGTSVSGVNIWSSTYDFTVPATNSTTWTVPRPNPANNPYALSASFTDRVQNGCGILRWGGAYLGYGMMSNLSEVYEMRNQGLQGGLNGGDGTDWSFNNAGLSTTQVNFTTIRALNTAVSPYIYLPGGAADGAFPGSSYPLTLNTSVSSTVTSFSINAGSGDAYEIPVYGCLLTMGSGEKCRITGVTGTSNPYTVTVERGSSGTTAASQSAGAITCNGRLAITSLGQIGTQLFEIVCTANHNFKTGQVIEYSGSGIYPNLYFTDGSNWGQVPQTTGATGTLTVSSGVVTAGTVTSGGSGFTPSSVVPLHIKGVSGGTGASGYASANSSGVVTSITISTGGTGYTGGATVQINGGTISGYSDPCMVTGPTTFVVDLGGSLGVGAVTLGPSTAYPSAPTSYTSLSNLNYNLSLPGIGFPLDCVINVNAQLSNCDMHFGVPMMASDSWCYWAANMLLAKHPAGRHIFLEMGDEPWNFDLLPYKTTNLFGLLNGWTGSGTQQTYQWMVERGSQVRTIFKSVFGSRASEIKLMLNIQYVIPINTSYVLSTLAAGLGAPIDAICVAPYLEPDSSTAMVNWVSACNQQQLVDTFIHNLYYSQTGASTATCDAYYGQQHNAYIATYNAATGQNCVLLAYEGGSSGAVPNQVTNVTQMNRDVLNDPLFYYAEMDSYAFLQAFYYRVPALSFSDYYDGDQAYEMYHSPWQPHGFGDGATVSSYAGGGYRNNRLNCATPGLSLSGTSVDQTKPSTGTGWQINQVANTDSVRGEAYLAWMASTQVTATPSASPSFMLIAGL